MFLELLHNKANFYTSNYTANKDYNYSYSHESQALIYVVDQLDLHSTANSSHSINVSSLDSPNLVSSTYLNPTSFHPTANFDTNPQPRPHSPPNHGLITMELADYDQNSSPKSLIFDDNHKSSDEGETRSKLPLMHNGCEQEENVEKQITRKLSNSTQKSSLELICEQDNYGYNTTTHQQQHSHNHNPDMKGNNIAPSGESCSDIFVKCETEVKEEALEKPGRRTKFRRHVASSSALPTDGTTSRPRKRGRGASTKNSEDFENQRMTHIAVERNRRKQMNDHLNILRSLMPSSYIQRGDQASIIGGAIEFVKELEQILCTLKLRKERDGLKEVAKSSYQDVNVLGDLIMSGELPSKSRNLECTIVTSTYCEIDSNVEVKLVGRLATVKVLAQRKQHQLFYVLSMIESLHLKIIQVNITTVGDSVIYYLNVEVEEPSQLSSSAHNIAKSIESIFRLLS